MLFGLSVNTCTRKTAGLSKPAPGFKDVPDAYPVTPILAEASGIADSKINPGYLWVEEDSGNPPLVTLLSHQGKILKTVS